MHLFLLFSFAPPAYCALAEPWESFVIGIIGASAALMGVELVEYLKIDDPVGR